MSKNKLYNQSYFVKRILDAGFFVTRLNIKFENDDPRKWMILINSKRISYKFNICVTCFKDKNSSDFLFKFQGQNMRDFSLTTKSMTTIIDLLINSISKKEEMILNERGENNE